MERDDTDPKHKLIARYDREAEAYQELWAPVLRLATRRLVGVLASGSALRVVDVATGVGSLLPVLHDAFPGALVFGVDRARGMLALAPREFPLALMDAAGLGIASGSVDVAVLAFVLFHLEDPIDGLREARRILREGGRVACATWAGELESESIRIWNECLDLHGASPPEPAAIARHEAVDTANKMEALLVQAGFADVRAWEEELASSFDAERLIRLKTRLGASKPRFDSLGFEAQAACVAEARKRMQGLAPSAFDARVRIVFSIGS